jgi:hypothetical protein
MDAIGIGGEGDIDAGVDKESRRHWPTTGGEFFFPGDDLHGFADEGFQLASGEIFFSQLDVVDACAGGFGDFVEELVAAREFVAGEGVPVRDVAEKAAVSHLVSAISLREKA